MDLHTSGHGFQEDQKLMLNLIKPKFFIPVHGYQSFLYKHAQTAQNVGIDERNIIIPRNGQVIELTRQGYQVKTSIKCTPILVSGSGIGDIGEQVLHERQQLGNNGLVVISLIVDKTQLKVVNNIQIITKGFTFYKENSKLFEEIEDIAKEILQRELSYKTEIKEIKQVVIREVAKYINKVISREPTILVLINEIPLNDQKTKEASPLQPAL